MVLLSCRKIKKSFGIFEVLKDITLDIIEGEKIGLVGSNGAGKSTFANIIFGALKPDEGSIVQYRKDIKTEYLLQDKSYAANSYTNIINEYEDMHGNHSSVARCLGPGKIGEWTGERVNTLSGGEKTRLALANIWATRPDFLILDEPTNHMDFQGVEWLVKQMVQFKGTALIISHDRYFLDRTVDRIIELEYGVAVSYNGNYSFFRDEKRKKFENQLHQYLVQEKNKEKIQVEIERLKNWANKAHREAGKVGTMSERKQMGLKQFQRAKAKKIDKQVKSKISRLKKIETNGVLKPKEETKVLFEFSSNDKHGKRVLEASGISKGYNGKILFKDSSFIIQRGDKIGLVGPNGCGKTTFVKLIMGIEKPDNGEMWVSPSVKIAYLSQDVMDLNENKTVMDMLNDNTCMDIGKTRTLLANMGFDEGMLKKKIKYMSLGERTRIRIASLILKENSFLILDEPTNHLDLHSREMLEETLMEYEGTIIIVSHDRYLLERICNRLLVFKEGKIQKIEAGFKEYMVKEAGGSKKANSNKDDKNNIKMLIDNRMALVLGELGKVKPGDERYAELDMEFKELVRKKRELDF